MSRDNWQDDAACLSYGVDVFFPKRTDGLAKARRVCARCPVLDECRADNDAHEPVDVNRMFGFFAGESANERFMRRLERAADVT